jgi:hypothetical protein
MARVNRPKADGDGMGWVADYMTTLVHWYPSFSREFVLDILPLSEGWVWYNSAILNDPVNKFGGIKMTGGYVAQESSKLIKQAHESWQANSK